GCPDGNARACGCCCGSHRLKCVLVPDRGLRLELVCDLGGGCSPHSLLTRRWPERDPCRLRCRADGRDASARPHRLCRCCASVAAPVRSARRLSPPGRGIGRTRGDEVDSWRDRAVCVVGIGNGMATLVRATALADACGPAVYGSIAGVAVACATGARADAPVAAAGAYAAFSGYQP